MRKAGGQRSASRRVTLDYGICASFVSERGGGQTGWTGVSRRAPFVMLTWPSPLASTVSLESPPAPMSIEPNRGWPAGRETGAAAFHTSNGDQQEKGLARSRRGDIEATRGWGRRSEQASRGSKLRARCNADMIGVSGRKREVSALTSGSDAKLARPRMPLTTGSFF